MAFQLECGGTFPLGNRSRHQVRTQNCLKCGACGKAETDPVDNMAKVSKYLKSIATSLEVLADAVKED